MTIKACGVTPELLAYLKGYAQAIRDNLEKLRVEADTGCDENARVGDYGLDMYIESLEKQLARYEDALKSRTKLDELHATEKIQVPEDL